MLTSLEDSQKKNFGKAQNFFYSPLDLERKQGIFKTVQFDAYC